ncbi:ubiquitin carboxyl-terminal hydrolase [Aspergillus steynii IBT 23096]|uniref:Ubiquitin carboxyl-terminal hydrolase n=1 Tax=Aspergillus steynii IBT 23096 TaxID=1392250 RepID=A0A2I2G2K1_9EURO|nr:ubiquitin carboxyl-terminal hydrolase [Aspergillus steynii IBT 23096]PLB47101.1 ubiquitin carboxyl-terminal hydrolase [Aspergillus steynii IBT 23096]
MAAAPLESSSTTPPDVKSTDSTRPPGDPMEDTDPQSTRKRPRLDSGSGIRENWSDKTDAAPMSDQAPGAPAPGDHEALASTRPPSRVTINVKSPTTTAAPTDSMASVSAAPEDPPVAQPDPSAPSHSAEDAGANASKAISLSSSPAQSPEIEVAELEDMDQDPNTSNWKPLGDALGEPDVVQLQEQPPLTETFPKLRPLQDARDNLEEICAVIEKGPPHATVFLAAKNWLDDVANNLDQLTYEVVMADRDFWEELPGMVESLLRRGQDLQPDEGSGPWVCFEEFFLGFARLALHFIAMDTLVLNQFIEDTELRVATDLISKTYLSALCWMVQINPIPFYRAMVKIYSSEVPNLVARINDQIASPPLKYVQRMSEFASRILTLIPRWPQLASPLSTVVTLVHNLVESGNERRKFQADDALIHSTAYLRIIRDAYSMIQPIDEKYQDGITKKSPWVTSDISDSLLRNIAGVYLTASLRVPDIAEQMVKNLELDLPETATAEDRAFLIYYSWKFAALKKHIMDGRMELRVQGVETMQTELVSVWRLYIQRDSAGIENPVVQYLVGFLRENQMVEYVVGIDSHPQLISRSGNIVGFLVVTGTYAASDTDTIWTAVRESPDPRTVSEILGMLTRTFHMHLSPSPALIYLCSKLLDFPLARFDARMVEFCEQLLHHIREKHTEKHQLLDKPHVDAIPLRVCVRLIRESAAAEDFSVEHKALLQKFASSQLRSFMNVGVSDVDKMETYERCVQDIAEMNEFAVGSIQALSALLPNYDSREIHQLATEFDLIRLVFNDIVHTVDQNGTDFQDSFSKTAFVSRIHLLTRIIDQVAELITPDLADLLWQQVFMSNKLSHQGRRALWDLLCGLTKQSTKPNPFVERCIHEYLPALSPSDYFPEVLLFAKQTISYEVRFNPPSIAGEGEVVSIPGIDRIWRFILTAPPGSIETDATNFAIEVYLDHNIIHRSPRSAVEATHIALVDRCVEQLKSAASSLKKATPCNDSANEVGEVRAEEQGDKVPQADLQAEELRFSRSLLFLRQFLQGLRSRPQYSPPQNSPPGLPERPVKGEPISLRYQAFDGSAQSKVRSLQIGDLSTASELYDHFVQLTGFSKMNIIFSGRRVDLLVKPELSIRELKLNAGLVLIRRHPDSREAALRGQRQSLTSVDSEVLKHFDDLYDLLSLQAHLAREIYDFLMVFPPQERVLQLVKSTTNSEQEMFPMDKPYSFLYSINTLMICLREENLESSPNQALVSHSIRVLVAALTRSEMFGSLENHPTRLMFATNLVECLVQALLVRLPEADEASPIPSAVALVQQLQNLIGLGRNLNPSQCSAEATQKLICHSFTCLIEGSARDHAFWHVVKQQVQLSELLFSLLLDESRQSIRTSVRGTINAACNSSRLSKKQVKSSDTSAPEPRSDSPMESPVRFDILATIWDAFLQNLPHTVEYVQQSPEFFEVALEVFRSVAEKSPGDLIFSEYLKQWSDIMFKQPVKELVGREQVDHVIYGFSRLIRMCLEAANTHSVRVDTLNLAEDLFDKYLFPDLSSTPSSYQAIVPRTPVLHLFTRQELYNVLVLLCEYEENYIKIVDRLDDIIPQGYTFSPNWGYDRQKMIRSPEGYAGLKNLSNTCYMNSLLSQLFMNVGFRDFMMQLGLGNSESPQKLLDETKKVFGYMQETWLKSVDPQGLVDSICTYDNEPVDVTVQMDVDEFYNLLFDRWEAQISDPHDKKTFRSFYGGQLVQQIKSKECPHISERLEPFSAIQCDIKGKANLEESLQAYVEGEIMQGDNKYSCTSCGRHVDAVKRACLKEVPDNLIFHLKRFDFDMVSMLRSKINDEFQFPERVDMSPFKVEYLSEQDPEVKEDIFELVGVLVHSGTAESGHYYSYIRERPAAGAGGSWVEFNDSEVSRFDPSRIPDQCFGGYNDNVNPTAMGQVRYNKAWNAYMLFYQRVSDIDSARSRYQPTKEHSPVRVQLPVPLANHITMENEIFIRTYCLSEPFHACLARYLLTRLHQVQPNDGETSTLDRKVVFILMDTLEQLISRAKEPLGLDYTLNEVGRAIEEIPRTAHRILQWVVHRPNGIRNLLKSPHAAVRSCSVRIFICALSKLQRLGDSDDGEPESLETQKWHMRYLDGFENVLATLEGIWPMLHTMFRAWDDYFEFLVLLASFGPVETGMVLNYGFLLKCLEIMWIDREDTKKLKRHYLGFFKLLEKGRRFSYRKLMDLLAVLLARIDFAAPPTPDDERRVLPDDVYHLTTSENILIRSLGKHDELSILKRVFQNYSSPPACRSILSLLLNAEPQADLMDPICNVIEDGLRVAPADLCAPYLDATLTFCRYCPDEDRITAMIEFVGKGVDSINDHGGKEHLAFFTSLMTCRNDRLGLDEMWFLSRLIEKIPDWVPTLLVFPDRAVRTMTMEILRRILFTGENVGEEWQSCHTQVARDLVSSCAEKLRKIYMGAPETGLEAKLVETMKAVIEHCLATYFDESEEDRDTANQARMLIAAVEELAVEVPEELGSEEWEDNSVVSDSEMGMAGSP